MTLEDLKALEPDDDLVKEAIDRLDEATAKALLKRAIDVLWILDDPDDIVKAGPTGHIIGYAQFGRMEPGREYMIFAIPKETK